MQNLLNKTNIKHGFKRFFCETFRRHTKEEYSDFFSRSTVNGEKFYKTYPFVYLRAFLISLVILAIAVILSEFTMFGTLFAFSVLLGGVFANIPIFLFIYELYPYKDVSFLKYFLMFLIGGFAAIVFSLLTYYVYDPANEWLSTLYTGVIEELFKFIPAVIIILALKNKNPLFGFLVGAAVGAGTSVIEDMYYIEKVSGGGGFWGYDFSTLVEMSAVRGLSSCCTHTIWAALICWAFCKFKKPLLNFRFYAVLLTCITLHFCWDMPLSDLYSSLVCVGCGAVALIFSAVVLYKERSSILKEEGTAETTATAEQEGYFPSVTATNKAFDLSHVANIVASLCLAVLAIFTLGISYSDWGFSTTKEIYFDSQEELIDYVQGGLNIEVDRERPYEELDDISKNYAYSIENGNPIEVTQRVEVENEKDDKVYEYYYVYYFSEDEKTGETTIKLYSVWIKVDEVKYKQYTYHAESEKIIYYDVIDCSVDYDFDRHEFYVIEYCDEYFNGLTESFIIGSIMGVIFIGGTAAFITLKIKSRRNKNDR